MDDIKLVFSDFDGTLTDGEWFSPLFFDVLDLLDKKKIPLVIVTGRSKSWGHFFLTHFPRLKYVISEGGGIISRREANGRICDQMMISDEEEIKLKRMAFEFKNEFPNIPLSADSFGRQTDRAIELFDTGKEGESIERITNFMEKRGVSFSISSVQINFWCGDISKFRAANFLLKEFYSFESDQCLFFGDALNDESMFQHIKNSVGVSNIASIKNRLQYLPSTILQGKKNQGIYGVYNYLSDSTK